MKHLNKFENFEPINEGLGSLIDKGISDTLEMTYLNIRGRGNVNI